MTTPAHSRVECMIAQVCVSMIFNHPLLVPAMMWLPRDVKMVTHVDCLASCAACFSLISSPSIRSLLGAVGSWRFTGTVPDISTSIGWSSNREATKSRLGRSQHVFNKISDLTYWLYGCNSAMYTGASKRTIRTLVPSLRSHRMHFESCEELRR